MSTFDTLPVILVSVADEAAATALISELIDNDVTDDYIKNTPSPDRVWRLVNKYYTVNVRVHTLTDNGRLDVDPDAIEAHIIHITENELSEALGGVTHAEQRAAGDTWRRAAVRLLLAECAAEPAALAAWAAPARAELVALREPAPAPAPAPAPFAAAGLARARHALHAHVWRGLVRTDRAAPPPEAASDSSCSGSDDEEADELRAVEHAEAFAAALGALGPALAARAGHDPLRDALVPPDARLDRAEALVAAFCRALGLNLDC